MLLSDCVRDVFQSSAVAPEHEYASNGRTRWEACQCLTRYGMPDGGIGESLVPMHYLKGKSEFYLLIDGTIRQVPVAFAPIESPYLRGLVKVICMTKPLCDVIVENVHGATDMVKGLLRHD